MNYLRWIGKRKATIIGPYRYHNFGDDLIGAVIAKHLQAQSYSVSIPLLGKENAAWLRTKYARNHEASIKHSDLLVIGGGGLLGDAGVAPDDHYRELALKAAVEGNSLGKRIVTTGIGAGPLALETSKSLTLRIASFSEMIGVRDNESKLFLQDLGVDNSKLIEGADLALLCGEYLKFTKLEIGKIGVQFDIASYADIARNNPSTANIYNAISRYVNQNLSNVILLSNSMYKSQLRNTLTEDCDTLCYTELQSFLPILAGLKAIFTSHLHLAITAYSQRIPCFSLYVREKTRRFYEQIGYPERAIDLNYATVEDFDRLIRETEMASWTSKDEQRLQTLQNDARKLLAVLN